MDKPAYRLADRILKRLIEEKIVSPEDHRKLLDKLATGTLTSDDWRLAVEIAAEREGE